MPFPSSTQSFGAPDSLRGLVDLVRQSNPDMIPDSYVAPEYQSDGPSDEQSPWSGATGSGGLDISAGPSDSGRSAAALAEILRQMTPGQSDNGAFMANSEASLARHRTAPASDDRVMNDDVLRMRDPRAYAAQDLEDATSDAKLRQMRQTANPVENARLANDATGVSDAGAIARFFDPNTTEMRGALQADKLALAGEPNRVAGESKVDVANIMGDAEIQKALASKDPNKILSAFVAKMTGKPTGALDAYGKPVPMSAGQAISTAQGMGLSGGGGAPQGGTITEADLQDAMRAKGWTRDQAVAAAQAKGLRVVK